jgi:hypothetical protein
MVVAQSELKLKYFMLMLYLLATDGGLMKSWLSVAYGAAFGVELR